MPKLSELASLVRSKNAGPFMVTFDVLFDDVEKYNWVKESGALSRESFAALYKRPVDDVRFFVCDNALGFKFSIPRHPFQGDLGDTDLHAGQQNALLMSVEIR